jgi:hypothetical protein
LRYPFASFQAEMHASKQWPPCVNGNTDAKRELMCTYRPFKTISETGEKVWNEGSFGCVMGNMGFSI